MTLARFRQICVHVGDLDAEGRYWAALLARPWRPDADGAAGSVGDPEAGGLRLDHVPEPKAVKNRVHLDVYARSLADVEAPVLLPMADGRGWTVVADPEGQEFCVFERNPVPPEVVHGLVVDTGPEPERIARWWGDVLGAEVTAERGFATVEPGDNRAFTMDFVPVPEPKQGPNRVHWDVWCDDVDALVRRGATVLRSGDWTVLADPDGNEFCAVHR